MKQGIQTTLKQNGQIVEYGCYFLCLLEIAGRITGSDITDGQVYGYYTVFTGKGWMQTDCLIIKPDKILNYLTGKTFSAVEKPKEKPDYPYYIIENVKPKHTHFTLCYEGKVWDPLDPARPAARDYKPNSYRLVKEVK